MPNLWVRVLLVVTLGLTLTSLLSVPGQIIAPEAFIKALWYKPTGRTGRNGQKKIYSTCKKVLFYYRFLQDSENILLAFMTGSNSKRGLLSFQNLATLLQH